MDELTLRFFRARRLVIKRSRLAFSTESGHHRVRVMEITISSSQLSAHALHDTHGSFI